MAVGWVLFAFEDIGKGWAFFKTMFGGAAFCDSGTVYQLLSYLPLLLLCTAASTPLAAKLCQKLGGKCRAGLRAAADVTGMAGIMALAVAYLISGSYNPFLYFRF